MFPYIKLYFEMGLYKDADLLNLKKGGLLSDDEYNQLVGNATTTDTNKATKN
ncbi:hypothetical protein [Lactobacillus plantarum] [Lactiplantibacillus mudanjiangensis]|uniref:XkdX family protein n=1 Tax=Lactiplantibacillus mudanjiangensis TaxID=1296538 RepID=UPI001015643D|nr:hypothetical protein [Lactobacillus plantarum] [Lactiplantibacillus mudanjiangensis]